jgi:hypothetical protein
MDDRADIDADTLVKIILVLVVAWLLLAIVSEVLELFVAVLGPLQPILGFLVLLLIVLWLLDRI